MQDNYIVQSFVLSDKDLWLDMDGKLPSDGLPSKLQWLHMKCDDSRTADLLQEDKDIDDILMESLLAEDTRPRTTVFPNGYFINLRGVSLNDEDDPHDMISIRMFVQEHRIITTSRKRLHAIDDLAAQLKTEDAPKTSGGIITAILELLLDRAETYIIELKDRTYELEYKIIEEADTNQRRQITEIRHAVITMSRYFSPQRDAASKLLSIKGNLFSIKEERTIMECMNIISKIIEDLDSLDNRCYVLSDEVVAITNDKINKKMYYISILATVFMPLTFLTGLFGVNLGGIPMSHDNAGFLKFCIILVAMLILQIVLMIKSKKF